MPARLNGAVGDDASQSPWFTGVALGGALSEWVQLVWRAETTRTHRLVPDGCVDLVWTSAGVVVCGTEDVGWDFTLPPGEIASGIRLKAGLAPALLRVPANEMANQRIDLADLLGRAASPVVDGLHAARRDAERVRMLTRLVGGLCDDAAPDRLAMAGMRLLDARPALSVAAAAGTVGLSERQFRRRVLHSFGFAPAVVRRVHRLHRFLDLGRSHPDSSISALAHAVGFHDHQHLVRDARAIGRGTPSELLGR